MKDNNEDKNHPSEKHPSDYLNQLEEWNEHQYDPGYWAGGAKKPPHIYRLASLYGAFFVILLLLIISFFVGGFLYSMTESFIVAWIEIVTTKKPLPQKERKGGSPITYCAI